MKKYLILFFILGTAAASAQVIFEPSSSSIYDLLNRLSVKGVIEFNDELKPLSRVELAGKLIEAANQHDKLTSLEREEIDYYDCFRTCDEMNLISA